MQIPIIEEGRRKLTASSPLPTESSSEVPATAESRLRGFAAWALGFWVLWLAILPLGHVTALRTALALPIVALTMAVVIKEASWLALSRVPGLAIWLLLLSWCGLSALWSPAPDVTWSKFRFDLLLPFCAFISAHILARFAGALRYLLAGALLGIALLALISLFAWLPAPTWLKTEIQQGTFTPMPFWYPGVGEASAYAVLLIGPLLAWLLVCRGRASVLAKWLPSLSLCAIFVIVVATNRRSALVVPLLVGPLFFLLLGRSAKPWTRKKTALSCAAILLVAMLLAGLFEYGARERLSPAERSAMPAGTSVAVELLKSEPRPQIWAYYLDKVFQHPWVGVGYGRTVPAIYHDTQNNRALLAIEANAATHAHNIALDWLLQVGLIGFALFAWLLASVARHAWAARARSRVHRLMASAVIATIAAMLLRNMVDDFLVYGIAIMFWAILGALLGLIQRAPD